MTEDTQEDHVERVEELGDFEDVRFVDSIEHLPPVILCERVTIERRSDDYIIQSWSYGFPQKKQDRESGEEFLAVRVHCDCRLSMSADTAFSLVRGLVALMQADSKTKAETGDDLDPHKPAKE